MHRKFSSLFNSDGNIYASVLTGYEIADRMKLIFGSIRDEFTKILRRMLR